MPSSNQAKETPNPFMRTMQRLMPTLSKGHVWLYRALRGRLVNRATAGAPVLLLSTVGAQTGKVRTVPIGHILEQQDPIVAGTNGGLAPLPSWVLNLRSNPMAKVQIGRETYEVRAEFLEGAERERVWATFKASYPGYAQAERWCGRDVPVVRLRRAPAVS